MRYHYVMTVQYEQRGAVQQLLYVHGQYRPAAGQTRSEVFAELFAQVAAQGGGTNPVPLFFSLEPDEL